jgi:predicted nuclease of predicted toxin-antitoxin system
VTLLLDEHYADKIADHLRAAGYDAQTVSERRLKGLDDESLLELCHREGRVLMTNNVRDFMPLARSWAAAGRDHAGLLFTSDASLPRHRGAIGRFVAVLSALMDAHPAERALANQVRWLP